MTRPTPALALCALTLASTAVAQEVNVYSYREPALIQPLMDAFTAQTGVAVNVAFLNKGLIERLRAESRRSPADLVFTVDISRLHGVKDAGLTQPVQNDALTNNIPAEFRDPENHWFGLTTRARIIYASKDRVAPNEVTTYEDLADSKWKDRICTRSGTHSYMLALTAAYLHHHGEAETLDWLKAVKSNLARKPQGNDRAQVKAIWAGECDIALGNTYYMGQMLADPEQQDWANSVSVEFPIFEDAGTHVNVSGMALTKSAPNRDDAIRLMAFLASPKAQEIYAADNFEYPIAPGTQADPLVQSWGSFEADTVNLTTIAKLRAEALRLTELADFDG
ncbi:Fe(3+) ABC transporter substrate-binding protein [uncultured Planktomarina sp.]|jgi:iron(III) transport system substrate-binding protein|uniref:Fe(3+) ABC transporter substrate-binding protein n=1 Tax=uncultured Planktomarina sp. TaxID=1538529 RepID=UPI0032610A8F